MFPRLKWHLEPETGWMNDPNGLVWFQDKYHAFYQHNPHAPVWDTMHWAHAVSDDLIHWTHLPIALYPDQPYENTGGCFSGSAIVKDGVLYLIYTAVSEELGQTQCVATSTDGIHFEKYAGNPVIDHYPEDGCGDFRDPKVLQIGDTYHLVVASGKDGCAKILHYRSDDLLHWEYKGVLFSGPEFGGIFECPDLFPLGEHYVLHCSLINHPTRRVLFVVGDFDGETFTPISRQTPEAGHFYASQSFLAPDGRRIMIGWMANPHYTPQVNLSRAGCLSLPRELSLVDGRVVCAPIREAASLLTDKSHNVTVTSGAVRLKTGPSDLTWYGDVQSVQILQDTRTIEVFINEGRANLSSWL